ncbi:MAG TPA: SLBB domain-containing protein [Chitinivibrionales bacterium]|nr:SLBB domain-containing protein [Chitinivibrionales bacterium]
MTTLIFVFLFGVCFAQYQADFKDSLALMQYLKQKGLSDVEIKNLRQTMEKRVAATQAQPKDTLKRDTTLSLDTTAARKKIDSTGIFSIYENMLRNKIVDPDSLLKTLTIFGLDIFTGTKPTTFVPADYGATPADYIVGTGDEVIVLLWGRINEEYRLKIDRDGKINIPRIGPLPVAGLPYTALQKNILDRVQNIEGVQTTVSLGELRSIGVFIVGEVKSPGYYTVSGLSNVTNALFAAGGPTRRGSLRNIQLKRNGSTIATVDFYDFLMSGSDNTRLRLKSGDVIMVPVVKKMVAIAGNVRRSALYEIKPNTTLKEALQLAGGVSPTGWVSRIQVERYKDNQFQVVLDLTSETPGSIPDFEVQDGDVIKIFPIVEKNKNAVYLSGNVMRPGKYEYKPGIKVSDIIPDFHALQPETYFDYALVLRQEPPSFLNRLIPFNLKKALDDHASDQNIPLQPRDEVVIYSRDYFEPERNVTIDGAVTNPGQQKLLENMKVRDLIIKAGGLAEEASPQHGEIYRRNYNGEIVSTEKISFCVSCALNDDSLNNILLKKFDRVYIRTKKGWEDERRVVLKGEFVFPGEYVILEKETLGHLIERAGGFTPEAYLPAALVTRTSVQKLEQKRNDEYVNRLEEDVVKLSTDLASKGQSSADAQALLQQQMALLTKLRSQGSTGRIVIDLTVPAHYENFNLEDGDSIFVPKLMGTVSVIGEVFNPATFRFDNVNVKAKYYVEMAGGFKENASQKNVYIFKANGRIVSNKKENVMEASLAPGDVIVVPQKIEYQNNFKTFMDTVDSIFKIASILSIIATLIILTR